MTREELEMRTLVRESDVIDKTDGSELAKAFNHLWEKYVEQEPCEDAISCEAVCNIVDDIRDCISVEGYWAILERLKKLSSVNPQSKTGHWIFVDKAHEHAHCSECDYGNVDLVDGRPHNYCPNCGAKMIEP